MRSLFLHPGLAAHHERLLPGTLCLPEHPSDNWDVLIRWGVTSGPDAPFTLNPLAALRHAASPLHLKHLLHLAGVRFLPTAGGSSRLAWRRYRVHMVDLVPVAYARSTSGGRFRRVRELPAERARILQAAAQRTLYATGLHFGAVDVGFDPSGRAYIAGLDPAPAVDDGLLEAYLVALQGVLRRLQADASEPAERRDARILMGADPEFVLKRRHTGQLCDAAAYFPPEGPVGYDRQATVRAGRQEHLIAEIRPRPSPHPAALVENIRLELRRALHLAPDLNTAWLAGSVPHPGLTTGGHIHFSEIVVSTDLLRCLDTYLALPALLLEAPERASLRRRHCGYLGEFRVKPHGGFEYRTLSSWLTGAERAKATLCLAKLVACEYPALRRFAFSSIGMRKAFYRGEKDAFRPLFQRLWADIEATSSYARYEATLAPLGRAILKQRQWRDDLDLRRRWHLV